MEEIRLVDVSSANWSQICCINPGEEGKTYVASSAYSIVQSFFENNWTTKGIYAGDTLVGFCMYGYEPDIDGYELCRYMIDERYQCMGYGKRALSVVVSAMFEYTACNEIFLGIDPKNMRGKHVYECLGFAYTGKTWGEGEDIEEVYCKKR